MYVTRECLRCKPCPTPTYGTYIGENNRTVAGEPLVIGGMLIYKDVVQKYVLEHKLPTSRTNKSST